jgi:hypothetical protein
MTALIEKSGYTDPDVLLVVSLKLAEGQDLETAKDKLNYLIFKTTGFLSAINRKADRVLSNSVDIKIRTHEDRLFLFIKVDPKDKITTSIAEHAKVLMQYLEIATEKQSANVKFVSEATVNDVLECGDQLIAEPLLEAFEINFNGKLWKRYRDLLFKNMPRKLRRSILPPALLCSDLKLRTSLETLDIWPEKLLRILRQRFERVFKIPKGKNLRTQNWSKVDQLLERFPLLESYNTICGKFFDASEVKVFAKAYGMSGRATVSAKDLSKLSPLNLRQTAEESN